MAEQGNQASNPSVGELEPDGPPGYTNTNQDEYILRMESRMRDLENTIDELRQNQTNTTPTSNSMPNFTAPTPVMSNPMMSAPPMSVPIMSMPSMPAPTISQPQYFYPNPFQGVPQYPYINFPFPTGMKPPCTYKQFLECKPPIYKGSTDPNITLNWLREMSRALDACNCEKELRVKYATRMLQGEAMVWWDTLTLHIPSPQLDMVTWDQFQEKICEKYCSPFEINRIKREFMELKMTDRMSVEDLIKQFNEKLRFVTQWVPDEQSQLQHFVDALIPEYRGSVRHASSLTHAFTLAKTAEGDYKARERMNREKSTQQRIRNEQSNTYQNKKWQNNQKQGNSGKRQNSSNVNQRPAWCNRCKSSHLGNCNSQTKRCIRCGVNGHEMKDCKFPRSVCWNCQKEGHRIGDCPSSRKMGSGHDSGSGAGSGTSPQMGQKRKNHPPPEGRAFRMTVEDAITTDDVITGKGKQTQ